MPDPSTRAPSDPAGGVAPATGRAASPARRIRAQATFETVTLLRNGEQLLVALVLPAMALVALALTHVPDLGPAPRIDTAVPGVLALAIISTAFTGQAIATGFDRRYGVLRLFGVTPLGRGGLLAAKALAVLVVELLQFAVLAALGLALGWRPSEVGVLEAGVFWLLGTWAFVALALLFAGSLRAEAVLALANLIWVLLLGLGGVVVPLAAMPAPLAHVAAALPSGALGEGLRTAFLGGGFDVVNALVLLGWALVATLGTARLFRWSD